MPVRGIALSLQHVSGFTLTHKYLSERAEGGQTWALAAPQLLREIQMVRLACPVLSCLWTQCCLEPSLHWNTLWPSPITACCTMQARRTQLFVLLLAAVLLCLAVPALQQETEDPSSSKSSKEAATEAPFAKGAKSEAADEDGPPDAAGPAPSKAEGDAPSAAKTTQPAAPAPATKAPSTPKPHKKSKIVEIAPEAEVQNEVDDIDVTGGERGAAVAAV